MNRKKVIRKKIRKIKFQKFFKIFFFFFLLVKIPKWRGNSRIWGLKQSRNSGDHEFWNHEMRGSPVFIKYFDLLRVCWYYVLLITYDPPLKKFHNRTDANEAIALKMSFAKCIKRDGKNYNKKNEEENQRFVSSTVNLDVLLFHLQYLAYFDTKNIFQSQGWSFFTFCTCFANENMN